MKDPKVGMCMDCSRTSKGITMFKGQQARGRGVEDMGGQMVEGSGGTT